jgi:hypothetical protein
MTKIPLNDTADYTVLKAAVRQLQSALGGIDGAAAITGRSRSVLGDYQNPARDVWPPLDAVYDMETASGRGPVVTEALARLHGMILVTAPRGVGAGGDMVGRVTKLSKEACEAVGRVNEAFNAGGRITADEIRALNLLPELDEAIVAAIEMRNLLAVIEDGDGEGGDE